MPTWEEFEEIFNLNSGADNVACRHWSRIKPTLEITLNPSNTKKFDSTEESYLTLYRKILIYIKTSLDRYITIIDDVYYFERCKSGKLHMHIKLSLMVHSKIAPMGIVYDLSEFILVKLLRRKLSQSHIFTDFYRIKTLPVCVQFATLENKDMEVDNYPKCRIYYWENYIEKNAPKNCV